MRLWSLHPSLLDTRGLVALWREALLAQKVLQDLTTGYRSHPQLRRFRECQATVSAIATYLWGVQQEATSRGYRFDSSKIADKPTAVRLSVTQGQLEFEVSHLRNKLKIRDPQRLDALRSLSPILPHPLFEVVPGEIESWERP